MTQPQSFSMALEQARKDRTPVMALRKLHDGSLDDVVVETPRMFRAEMMDEGTLWMACYFANDERVTFWVHADRKNELAFSVTEEPPEWLDWDEMRRLRAAPPARGRDAA